jgi:hypothetical protein
MRLINSQDLTRDAKLLGFVVGVVASVIWLSITLRSAMNNGWLAAYGIFMGAVSLGGAVWTAVDKIGKGTLNVDQQAQDKRTDAEDKKETK